MAKPRKRPTLTHCRVVLTAHHSPWRVWYDTENELGQRERASKRFKDEDAAWSWAEEKDREIANHGIRFGDVPAEVRRAYDAFRDAKIDLEAAGIEVPPFENVIADAVAKLRAEAASRESATVADCLTAFLDYKSTRVGHRQQADLRDRLSRFAEGFGPRPVAGVTRDEVEGWLSSLRSRRAPHGMLSPLARNHHRAALNAFFGWLHERDTVKENPVAKIAKEAVKMDEPEAYAAAEVEKLLDTALASFPHLVPALALGFFAGLRTSEIEAFDLKALDLNAEEFRISKSKTGPRIVPINDALRAWIAAQPRRTGRAWLKGSRQLADDLTALHEAAGAVKITNGMRHSFISYAVAESRNEAAVADIAGNSSAMIRKHYRQLVTAACARQFFAIRPKSGQVVIQLHA